MKRPLKAQVNIDMSNAAFYEDPQFELARILRDLADQVESVFALSYITHRELRDINGNNVGHLSIYEK